MDSPLLHTAVSSTLLSGASRARGSPTRCGAGCEIREGNTPDRPCSSSETLPVHTVRTLTVGNDSSGSVSVRPAGANQT